MVFLPKTRVFSKFELYIFGEEILDKFLPHLPCAAPTEP